MKKKIISLIVLTASFIIIFHDIDINLLINSFKYFTFNNIILLIIGIMISFIIISHRWYFINGGEISFKASLESTIISLGINNILPARMGEISKLLYLQKIYGYPTFKSLPLTVIERLFDLIGIASIGLFTALFMDKIQQYIIPFYFVLMLFLFFLILLIKNPIYFVKLGKRIKSRKIKRYLLKVIGTFNRLNQMYFIKLVIMSVIIWAYYIVLMFLFVNSPSEINITFIEAATIFVISAIGVSLPSSPGAIGVYEASIVLGMGWFGIEKEFALSFAILYHFTQIIITSILAFLIMYLKDFKVQKNAPSMENR